MMPASPAADAGRVAAAQQKSSRRGGKSYPRRDGISSSTSTRQHQQRARPRSRVLFALKCAETVTVETGLSLSSNTTTREGFLSLYDVSWAVFWIVPSRGPWERAFLFLFHGAYCEESGGRFGRSSSCMLFFLFHVCALPPRAFHLGSAAHL